MKTHLRYFPPTILTTKLMSLLKSSVILILRVHLDTTNSITNVPELFTVAYSTDEDWQRFGETFNSLTFYPEIERSGYTVTKC